jgi:hypothetical protein
MSKLCRVDNTQQKVLCALMLIGNRIGRRKKPGIHTLAPDKKWHSGSRMRVRGVGMRERANGARLGARWASCSTRYFSSVVFPDPGSPRTTRRRKRVSACETSTVRPTSTGVCSSSDGASSGLSLTCSTGVYSPTFKLT